MCTSSNPMLAAAAGGVGAVNRGRARRGLAPITIGTVVADAGYFSSHNLTVDGPDRLIAPASRKRLEHGTTPADADKPLPQNSAVTGPDAAEPPDDPVAAMKARLSDPEQMAIYQRRGVTVEPVNGHLKDR